MTLVEERAGRVGPLLGRDGELEMLETVLASVPEGPFAVRVEGDAGIGKTRVFEEALRRARSGGFRVLSCRPVESETQLGFAALSDLLADSLEEVAPFLPEPQRRALGVALLRIDPGEQPVDQRAVATGFLSAVRCMAEEQPILVAVDDVQWLDASSASVLGFAFRRLRDERIGVLVTLRTRDGDEASLALLRALEAGGVTRLQLAPLSLGAMQRLMREAFGVAFARPVLQRVLEASEGNPFFALELGRALALVGGASWRGR